jgi:hypothetical protein
MTAGRSSITTIVLSKSSLLPKIVIEEQQKRIRQTIAEAEIGWW